MSTRQVMSALRLRSIVSTLTAAAFTAIFGGLLGSPLPVRAEDCAPQSRSTDRLLASLFDDLNGVIRYPEPDPEKQASILRFVLAQRGIETTALGGGKSLLKPSSNHRLGKLANGLNERFGLKLIIDSNAKSLTNGLLIHGGQTRHLEINERLLVDPEALLTSVMVHERVHAKTFREVGGTRSVLLSGGIQKVTKTASPGSLSLVELFPSLKSLKVYSDLGFVSIDETKAYAHSALAALETAKPDRRIAHARWNFSSGMKLANAHLEAIALVRKRIAELAANAPHPPEGALARSLPEPHAISLDGWKYVIYFGMRAGETYHQAYVRRLDQIEMYLNTYLVGAGDWIKAQRQNATAKDLRSRGVKLMRALNQLAREADKS